MTATADTRKEPERSLRLSIIEGSFASIQTAIVSGALLTGYALALGANDFQLGFLSGMGTLATLGAVIGAQQIGRRGRRKPMIVESLAMGRSLWLLLCLIPFLAVPAPWKLALFLAVVLVAGLAGQYADTCWTSWMADLVPASIRGRYFSRRGAIVGAFGMAGAFGAGWLYDRFHAETIGIQSFLPFFIGAVVFGAISTLLLSQVWEPPLHGETRRPLLQTLRLPFQHPPFRRLLIVSGLWALVTGVAVPFYQPQMIKNLHMPFTAIATYAVICGAINLLTQSFWGGLIDRIGNKAILLISVIGCTLLPLFWLFASADYLLPVWIDAVLTGLFGPGITLTFFNLVMHTAPRENRTSYLAAHRIMTGLVAFLGALLGGWIAQCLAGWHLAVAGLTLVNFHVLFILTFLGRLLLWPVIRKLDEDRLAPPTHPV